MLDRPDLEDNRQEGETLGKCEYCRAYIMDYEEHYDIEGILVHEDCGIDFLSEFKKYAQ